MNKNALKPSKEQINLIFQGVAFCAKRIILYLCTINYELVITNRIIIKQNACFSITACS